MTHTTRMKKDDPEIRDQVGLQTDGEAHKALVLVRKPGAATPLIQRLTEAGFMVDTSSDPSLSLDECRRNTPHLAVVEENLANMSGIHFILDLLKVSWTTATILVSERDDEAIHEATEGLGILGYIKDYEDLEGFESLLKKFEEIVSPGKKHVFD
jgi:DNA-binding NarL/FixJ family response regulator